MCDEEFQKRFQQDLELAAKEEDEFLRKLDHDMVNCWECGREMDTSEAPDDVSSAEDIICPQCRG